MKISEKQFDYAYQEYAKELLHIAYGYTRNKEDSIDIMQNAYVALLESNKKFESNEHIKYFLIRVTINKSINFLLDNAENPFALFEDIYCQITNKGLPVSALSSNHKCDNILEFGSKFFSGNIEKLSILEKYIEEDFEACGNCRKWHKVPYIKH